MNTITKTIAGIFGMICLLIAVDARAQSQWSNPATVGSRPEVVLLYSYQWVTAGKGHQDLKIVCKNITTDKIKFKINYEVHFHNGDVERVASENTIELKPGEVYDPKSVADWGGVYMRYFLTPTGGKYGAKEKWFQFGKDSYGTPLYTAIHSVMNMKITDFENLSLKEREEKEKLDKQKKEAEEKKKKEEEEKKRKEAETKNQQTTSKKETSNNDTSNETTSNNKTTDDFWGDGSSSKKSTTSNNNNKDLYPKDENFVADSKFKDKLSGVKEGEYFTDGAGGYYKKELGGARKVDKMVYEREAANKIYEKMERQEAERQQRDAEFKQNWDNMSTSFYAMSAAKEGMRDAKDLGSGYSSIEELNAAFNQKMRQVSAMGSQMQASTNQAVQAYSNVISTGSSGYDYSGYTNAIGTIASAISANKAENEAREELKRQRAEEEARIKKVQLDALIAIRTEIGKVYTEGGMPLSAHKITAPVLYVFAYNSNKADWDKNQSVPMSISNIIPVYRYSDGTYPYTSNVKRTFENAGISSPVLMGYFTNKSEAENYRSSLLEVAPNAKFAVKEVEVKVKEQKPNTTTTTSETDFWGTKTETKKQDNTQNTETDFWGTQTKDKKAEPKKETKKEVDFWSK
ncbi:hypothetical protein G6R40_12185 [Chryseobacterium sp. POL2]|uniref:hypothetical protein n=1 Tax=Chryseobacterium sp. POL2 TaxID=2713414 RepID=UPI0013E10D2E|nr:hypothetical protein [Chryseobacterium sp. POL2]QIG90365.1 hypothetical protein G6R40_12185 [Chryseobacterium sp. POL2]